MMFVSRHRRKNLMKLMGVIGAGLLLGTMADQAMALEPEEEDYELKLLGKFVFFDKISNPPRMACVTCHDPTTGGTGSVAGVNLHQVAITGANPHTVGNLKPPTNAYASFIAPLHDRAEGCFDGIPSLCGGNFWDGRAEGEYPPLFPDAATKHIGSEVLQNLPVGHPAYGYDKYFGPTSDQALNPMPNPVEQNIERQAVCKHVAAAKYGELYFRAWGVAIDCRDVEVSESAWDVANLPEKQFDISFKRIMLAVGAWQHSRDLNSFTSKRDAALRAELACRNGSPDADPNVCNHPNYINSPGEFPLVGLTGQENLGHDLFYNTIRERKRPDLPVANCAFCHSDNTGAVPDSIPDNGAEPLQLYADDAYHNIGTPWNPQIPQTFDSNGELVDPDRGLMGLTGNPQHRGFFKTPTIRNVDKRKGRGFTKAYTHNGWFKSLESLVHFYNTAAIDRPTAAAFGITRCPEGIETEKDALANNCWPAPAVSGNGPGSPAIPFLLGDLGMTREHEAALVAYMKTLTDQHTAVKPSPYKSSRR
jgi:cytochrome c peroxidase